MRYRLKSDPSVECEVVESANHPYWQLVGWGKRQFEIPSEIAEILFEPIPEPAEPVLVEDELDNLRKRYPMSEEYAELLARVSAELRRWREVNKKSSNDFVRVVAERGDLRCQVQLLTQQWGGLLSTIFELRDFAVSRAKSATQEGYTPSQEGD